MKLKASPVTIVREDAVSRDAIIGIEAVYEDTDAGKFITLSQADTGRIIPIPELTFLSNEEVSWVGNAGALYTARGSRPADAALAGWYGYDLPVAVIGAIATGTQENPLMLEAVVDRTDQRVLTLLLSSDAGLFARYDSLWHPVTDPEIFDDVYLVQVTDDAIQLYDATDTVGGQVAAVSLPLDTPREVPPPPDTTLEESVVIASASARMPTISDMQSLAVAVEAAVANPEMRWYVERRAAALGAETDFPW